MPAARDLSATFVAAWFLGMPLGGAARLRVCLPCACLAALAYARAGTLASLGTSHLGPTGSELRPPRVVTIAQW